jgi:hypothetical protein
MIKYPTGIMKGDRKQIAVRFKVHTFEIIMRRAKREGRTFNEMVEDLCKCGELCLADSDKHEPKGNTK